MRKISYPRLRDYFSYNNNWRSFSEFYFFNQSVFNKFSLSVLFIILNLLLGIFIRACLIVSLSTTIFLFYLYLKTKKESQNIIVKRKSAKFARENDLLTVEYTLLNASSFVLENFSVVDDFDGTKENQNIIDFSKSIPVRSINIRKKTYKLNTGMGIKNFSNLVVYIADPLNIFKFMIIEDKVESIKVYPFIGKIKDMLLRGDKYALHFGLYETQSRGDTTNFIGIRPYRDGDPINRINWKLSMKSDKKVINEFEKNVNATFSIILNMDEKFHMGRGVESTWEYSKDICLSIAAKQISSSNTVQLFSNDTYVAAGSGVDHMNYLEMVICTLSLSKNTDSRMFLKKSVIEISNEAKVLYITPAYAGEAFTDTIDVLKNFAKVNPNIHVAFIDGTQEIAETVKGNMGASFKGLYIQTQKQLKKNIIELNDCGIECSIVNICQKIPHEKKILNSLNLVRGQELA